MHVPGRARLSQHRSGATVGLECFSCGEGRTRNKVAWLYHSRFTLRRRAHDAPQLGAARPKTPPPLQPAPEDAEMVVDAAGFPALANLTVPVPAQAPPAQAHASERRRATTKADDQTA